MNERIHKREKGNSSYRVRKCSFLTHLQNPPTGPITANFDFGVDAEACGL